MPEWLFQAVVTGVIALFGAWSGAWVGANLALDNFKKQRGYEARLEWHREAIQALHAFGAQVTGPSWGNNPQQENEVVVRLVHIGVESPAFMTPARADQFGDLQRLFLTKDTSFRQNLRNEGAAGVTLEELVGVLDELDALVVESLRDLIPLDEETMWDRARRVALNPWKALRKVG